MYQKWLPATVRSLKTIEIAKKFFSESGSCSKTEFTGTHITGDFAKIHTKVSWEMECSIDGKPGRITIRKEINGQTVWLDVSKCLGSQCQNKILFGQDCQKILDSQQRPEWNANNKVVQI